MTAKIVEGIEGKDFVFTITWWANAEEVLYNGTDEYLDKLGEIGEVEITDIKIVKRGV